MKKRKFKELVAEVEEFIAQHEWSNPHYLKKSEIIKYFSYAKKKHVRKAIKKVR